MGKGSQSRKQQFKDNAKKFGINFSAAIKRGNIATNSKVIVYYSLLSMLPMIILLANLIPLLHINYKHVMEYISVSMPHDVAKFIMPTVKKVFTEHSSGWTIISFVTAFWAASRMFQYLRASINDIYGIDDDEIYSDKKIINIIFQRLASLFIGFISIVGMIAVTFALVFGQQLLTWLLPMLGMNRKVLESFLAWKWPVAMFLIFISTMFFYYILPNAKLKLKTVVVGTIFTTISLALITNLFSLYVKYFGTSWNNYGIISSFIIFLLWLNASITVFMLGATINVSILQVKYGNVIVSKNNLKNKGVLRDES